MAAISLTDFFPSRSTLRISSLSGFERVLQISACNWKVLLSVMVMIHPQIFTYMNKPINISAPVLDSIREC